MRLLLTNDYPVLLACPERGVIDLLISPPGVSFLVRHLFYFFVVKGFRIYFKIQKQVVIAHEKWQVRVRQDAAEDARKLPGLPPIFFWKPPACIYTPVQKSELLSQ
ncbi:MAG: hypothetical protein ACYC4A_03280 [Desulfobulbia bacterium]